MGKINSISARPNTGIVTVNPFKTFDSCGLMCTTIPRAQALLFGLLALVPGSLKLPNIRPFELEFAPSHMGTPSTGHFVFPATQ